MERITRKQVEGIFKVFVAEIGGRIAKDYRDVGGYVLDYTACYGGYTVCQIWNAQGGQSQPFDSMRRSPREMWDTLHFAVRTLEGLRRESDRVVK